MNNIQNYGISNSQNVQFKGYVDKSIQKRIKSMASEYMRGRVNVVNDEIAKLIDFDKRMGHDVPYEKIQKLQEGLKQELAEVVDKTKDGLQQLNVFMEKLHPNSVLKVSKNGDSVVVANKVANNAYNMRCVNINRPIEPIRQGIYRIEDIFRYITGYTPAEIDEAILDFAIEDLEKMAPKTSLIGRFLTFIKMNMIDRYAMQIKSKDNYRGLKFSKNYRKSQVSQIRAKTSHMRKVRKTKEAEKAQQVSWDIFNNFLDKLNSKKTIAKADIFERSNI